MSCCHSRSSSRLSGRWVSSEGDSLLFLGHGDRTVPLMVVVKCSLLPGVTGAGPGSTLGGGDSWEASSVLSKWGEAQGVFFSGTSPWDTPSASDFWREDHEKGQHLDRMLPCWVGWLSQRNKSCFCLHNSWEKLSSSRGGCTGSGWHWPVWMDPANGNWSTLGTGPRGSRRHSLMLFLPWGSGCLEDFWLSFQASVKCPVWDIKNTSK